MVNLAIALAALAGSLFMVAHGGIGPTRAAPRDLDLAGNVLVAASTLPLVAWRRSALVVFALTSIAGALTVANGYRMDLLLGPGAALYLVAASRSEESPWTLRHTSVVLVALAAYAAAAAIAQETLPVSEVLHTGLAWSAAWFAGERTRLRREQLEELRTRAERERILAAAAERARIARDLHDSVGNAVNVIAVRAGAARLRHDQDPARAAVALSAIEDLARQAAADIDQIVRTLREDERAADAVEAPSGLASLDGLVARHRAAGLDVAVDASGEPRRLAAAADQAAFRILQEALANAARHGAGRASVRLSFGADALEVVVTNPTTAQGETRSGGHGLVGMRERATLLGGRLETERVDGSFSVRASIPYAAHA